jgi:hypothetical protein
MSKTSWIRGAALGLALLFAAGARADGGGTIGQCVADARAEAKTCAQLCRDDFRAAKDSCRNLDHDCAEAAREQREACVSDVLTALTACVTTECSAYAEQIEQCRETHPLGSAERDACIDNAQLLRFQCRDACRESVQLHPGLRECRVEFRAAIKACPKPDAD